MSEETVWRICNFDEYEVTGDGRAWRPGKAKRQSPLLYYRSKCYGGRVSRRYRKLVRIAGADSAASVFGIFHKLMEFASLLPVEYRGWLVDPDDLQPWTVDDLADETLFPAERIAEAITVLLEVGWLVAEPYRVFENAPKATPAPLAPPAPTGATNGAQVPTQAESVERLRFPCADGDAALDPQQLAAYRKAYDARIDVLGTLRGVAFALMGMPSSSRPKQQKLIAYLNSSLDRAAKEAPRPHQSEKEKESMSEVSVCFALMKGNENMEREAISAIVSKVAPAYKQSFAGNPSEALFRLEQMAEPLTADTPQALEAALMKAAGLRG